MPPRPQSTFPVWQPVTISGIIAFIIVILHSMLPDKVSGSVYIAEFLALAAVGVSGGVCSYLLYNKAATIPSAAAPASGNASADLALLRKESADNLHLLQQDLHNLGTAVMKRLNASTKPEVEHFEAIAGTVTDLAISLAEAREALGAIASDIAETKSTIFEIQAQVDQQADALHAFEHALGRSGGVSREAGAFDAGEGAAPGSLGKALVAGAAGVAVARLIGGASKTAPAEPVSPESVPLASTDIEGNYESEGELIPGEDFAVDDPITTNDWPEQYFEKTPDLSKAWASSTPEESAALDEKIIEEEESVVEGEEWADAKLIEPSSEGSELPDITAESAAQPDLLPLDAPAAETRRKPRRPGRNDTALVAHVMIGIGNKPYLRGYGPGLSPDKGVPMEYVDVGRWQWISPEAGSPLNVTLWKNDEVPAEGGAVSVPSGMTLEIHPAFSH